MIFLASCMGEQPKSVTVPFILGHNRMLVDAEFQLKDSSWHKAVLWIDTGNPDFFISEEFVREPGTVVDALRGKPGEKHTLTLERKGSQFNVEATVEHIL